MKLSCNIVRDLLPLYRDKVCSEESRSLVTEHLKNCESCQKFLRAMEENIEDPLLADQERSLNAIKKTWESGKKKSFRRGLRVGVSVLTALILLVALIFFLPIPRHYTKTYTTVYHPDGTPANVTITLDCWRLSYLNARYSFRGTLTVKDNETGSEYERLFELEDQIRMDRHARKYRKKRDLSFLESPFEEAGWINLYTKTKEAPRPSRYTSSGFFCHLDYFSRILVSDENTKNPKACGIYLAADDNSSYEDLYALYDQEVFTHHENLLNNREL